jgi:hypothetical protein
VGVFAHVLKQNYTLMYYTLMYNFYPGFSAGISRY